MVGAFPKESCINMIDFFELPGKVSEMKVIQSQPECGTVKVNTICALGSIWKGQYISSVPITVEAVPSPGYRFVKWKRSSLPDSSKVEVTIKKHKRFEPVFEKIRFISF